MKAFESNAAPLIHYWVTSKNNDEDTGEGGWMMRYMARSFLLIYLSVVLICLVQRASSSHADEARASEVGLRIATFDIDASPPVGLRMAYNDVIRPADLSLRCRGIILIGAGKPIVLAAIDWIGVGNGAHQAFRQVLAKAVLTSPERVAVQSLHQHDAPQADFTAEALLDEMHIENYDRFDGDFARGVFEDASNAAAKAIQHPQSLTHVGFGKAKVHEVASNRRLIGDDGMIRGWRGSTTRKRELREEPEGLIDPFVHSMVLWSEDIPIAVITSYATHPMSYYRTGVPGPDFPGIARLLRAQDLPSALHIHFTGAGGNVAAGKYNDGSHDNRVTFALRLAAGMRSAYEAAVTDRRPIAEGEIGWSVESVTLGYRKELQRQQLAASIRSNADQGTMNDADALAWITRVESGRPVDITCLRVGDIRMLHMPGELFVEYQLAAQSMRPDLHVMMAAYGDYGPGYIGTAASYAQGGYEVDVGSSFVGPDVEDVLKAAMRKLLKVSP